MSIRNHLLAVLAGAAILPASRAAAQAPPVLGDPVDVSQEFQRLEQTYFVAARVTDFDPGTGRGTLQWDRYARQPGYSFAKVDLDLARARGNEFPGTEYETDPALPFAIDFISPRTVRLRFSTRNVPIRNAPSLMLAGTLPVDRSWRMERTDSIVTWTSRYGRVRLILRPWHVEFYDATGRLLTRTRTIGEPHTYSSPTPFSFIRRASDMGRSTAAAFVDRPNIGVDRVRDAFGVIALFELGDQELPL